MINTENLATQRIGDIVSENYHTAGVFKEFGIDFCCGGGRPLNEVCEKKGLSLDEVVQKLNTIPWQGNDNGHNYREWDAGFLIDYIINTHHAFVRKKTEEISVYAAKVAQVHGENHPENVDIFKKFVALANDMIEHLEAEETTVFPLIKNLSTKMENGDALLEAEKDKLRGQLSLMEDDHDGAG
jgi:regulator of cell morphogenesis and NO signaling